jgi:two-component system, response regulator
MRTAIDVLVVDASDRDARTTLAGIRRGSETATVLRLKDGDQALHYLYRTGAFADRTPLPPRMILLEIELPLMSGLLVLDRLQADPSTRGIPAIAFSFNSSSMVIDDAIARGAREYILKHADKGEYIEEVAQLVNRWAPEASGRPRT